jgi:hypothetical protein
MTSRRDKIRKLRALARSPNKHEAALALEKAQAFEATMLTAKALAHAVGQLLEARGMVVRVKPHRTKDEFLWTLGVDAEARYRVSRHSRLYLGPSPSLCVEIIEYDLHPRAKRLIDE